MNIYQVQTMNKMIKQQMNQMNGKKQKYQNVLVIYLNQLLELYFLIQINHLIQSGKFIIEC
jgi:hypothetical protein